MLDHQFNDYPTLRTELYKSRNERHPAIHILVIGQDVRYLDGFDAILRKTMTSASFRRLGEAAGEADVWSPLVANEEISGRSGCN